MSKLEIDSHEAAIRDFIVRNYATIFDHQIWNVQTGRPVLEETFLWQLPSFFFFWHVFSVIPLNMLRLAGWWDDWEEECSISSGDERIDESLGDEMIDEFRGGGGFFLLVDK